MWSASTQSHTNLDSNMLPFPLEPLSHLLVAKEPAETYIHD